MGGAGGRDHVLESMVENHWAFSVALVVGRDFLLGPFTHWKPWSFWDIHVFIHRPAVSSKPGVTPGPSTPALSCLPPQPLVPL